MISGKLALLCLVALAGLSAGVTAAEKNRIEIRLKGEYISIPVTESSLKYTKEQEDVIHQMADMITVSVGEYLEEIASDSSTRTLVALSRARFRFSYEIERLSESLCDKIKEAQLNREHVGRFIEALSLARSSTKNINHSEFDVNMKFSEPEFSNLLRTVTLLSSTKLAENETPIMDKIVVNGELLSDLGRNYLRLLYSKGLESEVTHLWDTLGELSEKMRACAPQ